MGDILSNLDDEADKKAQEWKDKFLKDVSNTSIYSAHFGELQWLVEHWDKIIGNKQILNLLR